MNRIITAVLLLFAAVSLRAQSTEINIVNCWDSSFAYTQATVSEYQPGLLKITLQSEDQKFLKNTVVEKHTLWGHGEVTFYTPKTNCKQDIRRPDVMGCQVHGGNVQISFQEDDESSRNFQLPFKDLNFSTTITNGSTFTVNLSFSGANPVHVRDPSTIQLLFRLNDQQQCYKLK